MSRNALILLISFFLYVSSPSREIDAKSTNVPITQNPATSILDAMTKDEGLCAAGKPFSESRFAKICKSFEYPKDNVTLKSSNSEQFMCLGFYDRIYRLCHLDTLRTTEKSVLPDNAMQFDQQVAKVLPKNEEAIFQFCKTWKNNYPPKYNKTERFTKQLENLIRKPALCVKYCTADDDSVVPLCVVLATMDDMSELTANGVQSIKAISSETEANRAQMASLQFEHSQVAVKQETEATAADSQKPNDPKANVETTVEAGQSHISIESQRTAESSDDHVAESPQESPGVHDSPVTQTGKFGTDAQGTGAHTADGALEAKTKATVKKTSGKTDYITTSGSGTNIEASKDSKKNGTPANGAAIAQSADGAAPALPADDTALAPPDDGAVPTQHESVEDISGEDIGRILDAAKLGSISQHTQDDPETEFGGADGLDPAAVEPPALVDEDPDQSAVQPSEKREYIPHLPSPNEDDSHFFGYFTVIGVMCIAGYVGYHNKQKILAMVLEGRRSRGGRNRRRPSTANYRKLDCTLEEAVTSQCNSNVTHVIY